MLKAENFGNWCGCTGLVWVTTDALVQHGMDGCFCSAKHPFYPQLNMVPPIMIISPTIVVLMNMLSAVLIVIFEDHLFLLSTGVDHMEGLVGHEVGGVRGLDGLFGHSAFQCPFSPHALQCVLEILNNKFPFPLPLRF